jgi:hypothetical protein
MMRIVTAVGLRCMILGVTLVAIVVAYLVLRRTGQEREGAGLPGV